MKSLQLLILTILALAFKTNNAQQLYKCDSTISYWVFEKDSTFFVLKLLGNVRESQNKNVIAVNSFALQCIILDKQNYIKSEKDTNDLRVLVNYALSEAEYFSGQFKQKVNIQLEKVPGSGNKSAVLWFFEMPSEISKEVKHQVFVNIIIGNKVYGLSSSQFANQNLDDVKNFLKATIVNLEAMKTDKDLSKLCGN